MSRPEFPNCIMPASTIRRIRENQDAYDKDPERYERMERLHEEERQREQYEEEQERRRQEND